jgi:hypothetical protein
VLSAGSWGDPVCDAGLFVFSHTALVVAFMPPVLANYTPSSYTVMVRATNSSTQLPLAPSDGAEAVAETVTVSPGQSMVELGLPAPMSGSALRYVLPSLVEGQSYTVHVGSNPPTLPIELAAVLPRPVPVVLMPVQPTGGCRCAAMSSELGCGHLVEAVPVAVTPQRPVISKVPAGVHCVLPKVLTQPCTPLSPHALSFVPSVHLATYPLPPPTLFTTLRSLRVGPHHHPAHCWGCAGGHHRAKLGPDTLHPVPLLLGGVHGASAAHPRSASGRLHDCGPWDGRALPHHAWRGGQLLLCGHRGWGQQRPQCGPAVLLPTHHHGRGGAGGSQGPSRWRVPGVLTRGTCWCWVRFHNSKPGWGGLL